MNRKTLLLFCALLLLPAVVFAQETQSTPRPDPRVYTDAAMRFVAPEGFRALGQRQIPVEALGSDPQVVAAWVQPDAERSRQLLIQQQAFDGSADAYASDYQQFLRNAYGDALVKNKENMSLRNGMPAVYMEMTTGNGFNTQKFFLISWADGVRGVTLSLSAPVGELDKATALRVLSDASAVRYPRNRD